MDQLGGHFAGYELVHINRRKNEEADALSRLGSKRASVPPEVFLDQIHSPSISIPSEVDITIPPAPDSVMVAGVYEIPDWTTPFMEYLEKGTLPTDEVLARQIVRRAKGYTIINNELYKRGQSGVFMRCIPQEQGYKILQDIRIGRAHV